MPRAGPFATSRCAGISTSRPSPTRSGAVQAALTTIRVCSASSAQERRGGGGVPRRSERRRALEPDADVAVAPRGRVRAARREDDRGGKGVARHRRPVAHGRADPVPDDARRVPRRDRRERPAARACRRGVQARDRAPVRERREPRCDGRHRGPGDTARARLRDARDRHGARRRSLGRHARQPGGHGRHASGRSGGGRRAPRRRRPPLRGAPPADRPHPSRARDAASPCCATRTHWAG